MLLLLNNDVAWLKKNPEEYKTNRNFKYSAIFADSLKKKKLKVAPLQKSRNTEYIIFH